MSQTTIANIVLAAAEITPLAKVGGLGDYVGSLPKALVEQNVRVSVATPFHETIAQYWHIPLKRVGRFTVMFYHRPEVVTIWRSHIPDSTVPLYLFHNDHYLSRGDIYTSDQVWDPVAKRRATRSLRDVLRYLFFSLALAHWLEQRPQKFNIVHANDWQLGPLCALLKTRYATAAIRTLFMIHNVDFVWQGVMKPMRLSGKYLELIPPELRMMIDWRSVRQYGYLRPFKLGLIHADMLCTVSPQYAKELQTPYYGKGLETVLRARSGRFYSILNGIDTAVFNPATDIYLVKNYSVRSLVRRRENKTWLQNRVGFTPDPSIPLLGMVARITGQKGIDVFISSIPTLQRLKVQCLVVGVGQDSLEKALKRLQRKHKSWLYFHNTFDIKFSQRIYAGSDIFLMPSHYEPCGLAQLIAMRYGTVPIVHGTGGLKDTVAHKKTGFVYAPNTAEEFSNAIQQAVQVYRQKPRRWQSYIKAGMSADHSWNQSAKEYSKLYRRLLY